MDLDFSAISNPWAAYAAGRKAVDDINDARTRRLAGASYAAGDYDGASQIFARYGDIGSAERVRQTQRQNEADTRARSDEAGGRLGAKALASGRPDEAAAAYGDVGDTAGVSTALSIKAKQLAQKQEVLTEAAPAVRRVFHGGNDSTVAATPETIAAAGRQLESFRGRAMRAGVAPEEFDAILQAYSQNPEGTLNALDAGAKREIKMVTTAKGVIGYDGKSGEVIGKYGDPPAPKGWDWDDAGETLVPQKGGPADPTYLRQASEARAGGQRSGAPPKWIADPTPAGGGRAGGGGSGGDTPYAIRGSIMAKIRKGQPLTPGEQQLWDRGQGGSDNGYGYRPSASAPPAAATPRAAAAPASGGGIVNVRSPEEAAGLAPGTLFRTPDGRVKRKH